MWRDDSAHIDDRFQLPKDLSQWRAHEGNEIGYEAGFANEDVEESLMNLDKLGQSISQHTRQFKDKTMRTVVKDLTTASSSDWTENGWVP